jgi:polysaccharide pyruvyl transferase CsaB
MSKRVMIAGYYGAKNTGDEAILTGMIHSLQGQGIQDITVLSRDPEETQKFHGVKSIYIGRRFDGLQEIRQQMRRTDLFLLGGGGLLQDYTSRVVPYWLSRVLIALISGTPVMYYAQGLGPLRTSFARRLVRLFSNRVKQITVRDEPSHALLKEVGVTKPPIQVTADPALGIKVTTNGKNLLEQEGISMNPTSDDQKLNIGISLRSWKDDHVYLPSLIASLKKLQHKANVKFIFCPFQYGEDEKISQLVMNSLDSNDHHFIKGTYTPEQMAAMLKEMDGVIAMRLHAIILSAISNVPSFGLVYDPKVLRFMERAGIDEHSWSIEQIKTQEESFQERLYQWVNSLPAISEKMQEPVNKMIQQSVKNAEIARSLLEDK